MQRALMLSRAGQCGIDTTKAGLPEVHDVATMDKHVNYEHADLSESSLYNASILNLHGLPSTTPPFSQISFLRAVLHATPPLRIPSNPNRTT